MSMNELNSELNKIQETKTLLKEAIINKGQEVLDTDSFRSYVDKVNNITTGIDTSDATATANDIADGKTAYVNGNKISGKLFDGRSTFASVSLDEVREEDLHYEAEMNKIMLTAYGTYSGEFIANGDTNIHSSIDGSVLANKINLSSDKIIEGNTILGIEGTGKTSEDLQEQLDTQDTIIQQLQDELANKTSGSAKPNIFMQETEPTTKNGIWLKGNYQVDNIVADESVFAGEEWNTTKMSNLKTIPDSFYYGSAVSIGTNVYLFGSYSPSCRKYAYKYDTLTDTYTQLANIPYDFYNGSAVSIGTDVYLFGSVADSSHAKYAYKYNTLTNTYTQLTNIAYEFYGGSAVSVGTNVYLFGTYYNSSYYRYAYKYDTLTDTYTKLTNIPYAFYYGSAVSIGTDVYLFGGNGGNTKAYKYDTLTDTYTQLTNIPYDFLNGSAVSVGTDIYLFGGQSSKITSYKYDTLTDTYTQLANIPYDFYNGSAAFNGIDIYLFGGSSHTDKVQIMTMIPNDYGNNSVVISQGVPNNKTNIANYGIQNAKFYYDRVYYQDENGELLNTIPTYNGNGTEWVKISGGEE